MFQEKKSYRTIGGWKATVTMIGDIAGKPGKKIVECVHYLGQKSLGSWTHDSNGKAKIYSSQGYPERPFPSGWDHPSDLTEVEWVDEA